MNLIIADVHRNFLRRGVKPGVETVMLHAVARMARLLKRVAAEPKQCWSRSPVAGRGEDANHRPKPHGLPNAHILEPTVAGPPTLYDGKGTDKRGGCRDHQGRLPQGTKESFRSLDLSWWAGHFVMNCKATVSLHGHRLVGGNG